MIKDMSIARCHSAHAVLMGTLYVMGGSDDQLGWYNSVEYYVPSTDKWEMAVPMRQKRASAKACAINGLIYVLGGVNWRFEAIQTIERYNPRANSWTEVFHSFIRLYLSTRQF